jgi:hypothetical protein
LLITYLVSVGSILTATLGSGRKGHGTRTINDILVAFQLTAVAYYIRIGLTSELEPQQRILAIVAGLMASLSVLIAMRNASTKRFLRIAESDHNVTRKVLWPNITLGMISLVILFCIAPKLPQPQLSVRAPSGKPAYLSVEGVLPSQDIRYDGAPLYVLDHIPHLQAGAATSAEKFVGVIESENIEDGSGPFKWVLRVPNELRNFSISVRTAYLVNDNKPRPFQLLDVMPRGEPPYHQIEVSILESRPGDRILVVISLKQVAPGNHMPKDVRGMFDPKVE